MYLLYRPLSQWVLCLTASALLAAATALLTAHGTTLRQKGLLYAAALSLALVPVTVEGLFSVGKALLMTELLLLSRRLPPLTAGLAGACAGLAADLVPETPALLLTVAYGCGGALAAFYGRLPRILPAAAFSLPTMALAVLLDVGPPRQLLLSCLVGGAAYLLLPRRWLPPCAERAARADAPGETAKPRRLEQSAAALRSLYDSFFRDTAPAPPENPSVIFDRAAEQVCRSCVLCANCWQQNYNATYNAFNDACPALLRRGTAQSEDFPLYFTARCVHLREFVAAVNEELLENHRELPRGFADDMILNSPSPNLMNKMARSVLAMYSYDEHAEDLSLPNILRQSINLIAELPTMMVNAYQIKRRVYDRNSMYFHLPNLLH